MLVDSTTMPVQISLLHLVFFLSHFTCQWLDFEVAKYEVGQQGAEEVLETQFFVAVCIDPSHDRVQVPVTDKVVFLGAAGPCYAGSLEVVEDAGDLLASEAALVAGVEGLEQLCNLEIDV